MDQESFIAIKKIYEILQNHAHIEKVEVFTGPDDYAKTDGISISAEHGKLIIDKDKSEAISKYRYRNEPCLRIHFSIEETAELCSIAFYHHKGAIYAEYGHNGSNTYI